MKLVSWSPIPAILSSRKHKISFLKKEFKRRQKFISFVMLLSTFFLFSAAQRYEPSNQGYIVRGTARTLASTMEIPRTMLEHSAALPFPLGIATGALAGSFRTVLGVVAGAADIARGAAPYAKYAIFLA